MPLVFIFIFVKRFFPIYFFMKMVFVFIFICVVVDVVRLGLLYLYVAFVPLPGRYFNPHVTDLVFKSLSRVLLQTEISTFLRHRYFRNWSHFPLEYSAFLRNKSVKKKSRGIFKMNEK